MFKSAKRLCLFAALLLLILCLGTGSAEQAPGLTRDVVVLFTSDVHCGMDQHFGYVGLQAVRDSMEAAGNHVLLVDDNVSF